jgi:hypothetical protein
MVRTCRSIYNGETAPAFVGRQFEWRPANDLRAIGGCDGMRSHDARLGWAVVKAALHQSIADLAAVGVRLG